MDFPTTDALTRPLHAMALGRIALGVGSLAAPGAMAQSFGARSSPELDYMTRVFGGRAIGGPGGVIRIQDSARELSVFIDRVRRSAGARKVDLVGHSEGTFMPQYYLKFLGGAAKVRRYVAYTPLYRGTELAGVSMLRDLGSSFGVSSNLISLVSGVCGSCPQFLKGSRMQRRRAAGGAAVPGVEYTTVMTRYDELVVPYTSGFLPGQRNFVLQDLCPANLSEHGAVAIDPVAAQITFNALAPRRARPIRC